MAKLVYYPDNRLRTKCDDLTEEEFKTEECLTNLTSMVDHLAVHKALGIAAPQIGWNKRIFLNNVDDQPQFFINPVVVKQEGEVRMKEGCLSFPNLFVYVNRYQSITIDALDADGKEFRACLTDLDAVCAQHELDHLDGVLFIDRVGKLEQRLIRKKIAKFKKKFVFPQ